MTLEQEFYEIVKDILESEEFIRLKSIKHHTTTRYDHSVAVAYKTFVITKKFKMDSTAATRGALLHDFFFLDSRNHCMSTQVRSFVQHPKIAAMTAKEHFDVSDKEQDIIAKHMFPTTITPPKYKEGWVVTGVDKWFCLYEVFCKKKVHKKSVLFMLQLNKLKFG